MKMAPNTEGLASWLVARLRVWQGKSVAQQRQMQLVETLPLGGRRQLMLVACGGERYLVGGGPDSIEAIVRLTSQEFAAKGQDEPCV